MHKCRNKKHQYHRSSCGYETTNSCGQIVYDNCCSCCCAGGQGAGDGGYGGGGGGGFADVGGGGGGGGGGAFLAGSAAEVVADLQEAPAVIQELPMVQLQKLELLQPQEKPPKLQVLLHLIPMPALAKKLDQWFLNQQLIQC